MVLVVFVLVIFAVYLVDMVICTIYCKKKKQKDLNELHRKVFSDASGNLSDREQQKDLDSQKGLTWKVKQLLNGWMFYRARRLGRVPCQKYRTFILKHVFQMEIADHVVIYSWGIIRAPWNISIGRGTIVGSDASLDGRNFIKIGENVNISTGINIYTEQHDINDPYFRSLNSGGSVVIENRAWISSHSIILPNVHVGEGAILASGALTAKDLDAFGIYAGVPAKKIGERTRELKYEFEGEYLPFI